MDNRMITHYVGDKCPGGHKGNEAQKAGHEHVAEAVDYFEQLERGEGDD